MFAEVLDIAASIISRAGPQSPADSVLRTELKSHRHISPESSRAVSRAVFAYYRWWKWLEGLPLTQQLARATELQQRFSSQPSSFSDDELAARAVPSWAREAVTFSPEWLRALQSEPRLWLRARPGQRSTLINKLGNARPFRIGARAEAGATELPDALEYVGHTDLFRTPEFHGGEFEIQDISSQLVSLLCGPNPGETWWDACCGEGGKTLHFSDLMQNKGLIWASDCAEWRLQKLKRRAARAKVFNYRAALWEGGAKLPTRTKFDGVLIDAPCAGLGTWQRNPHARWTTTPLDVHELAEVQSRLLAHAASAVKPGGKLIYAVCTLTRAETLEVAKRFAETFPEFQPLPLANLFAPATPPCGELWIWPQDSGGNGMFVAAWRRTKAP